MRRQAELRAELVERLVNGKTPTLGGDFEQDAGRLAVVDGFEVRAINDGTDLQAVLQNNIPGRELRRVIGYAEGDVMDRPGPVQTAGQGRVSQQVHVRARSPGTGLVP